MPIQDAARLLRCAEGTVRLEREPRARSTFGGNLADLDPLKASRSPASKWHEFLGRPFGVRGSLEQIDFAITPLLGPHGPPQFPLDPPYRPELRAISSSTTHAQSADHYRFLPTKKAFQSPRRRLSTTCRFTRIVNSTDLQHVDQVVRHTRRANLLFPRGLKKSHLGAAHT